MHAPSSCLATAKTSTACWVGVAGSGAGSVGLRVPNSLVRYVNVHSANGARVRRSGNVTVTSELATE